MNIEANMGQGCSHVVMYIYHVSPGQGEVVSANCTSLQILCHTARSAQREPPQTCA